MGSILTMLFIQFWLARFVWSATSIQDDFMRISLVSFTVVFMIVFFLATIINGDMFWGVGISALLSFPILAVILLIVGIASILNKR